MSENSSGIEMIALNVGKGDATLLRCGSGVYLVDTGRYRARKQLMAAFEQLGITELDAVFITHSHNDHSGGLRKIRKSGIRIGKIYASRYHPACKTGEHPAVVNAEKLGMKVNWLSAGDIVSLGDSGAAIRVLAPIKEIRDNENDNSLVMMLESPDGNILLTGDMELKEESMLRHSGADLQCMILKVPDHGARDACSEKLIRACKARAAVISTNTEDKPKTPDAELLRNLKKHGCEYYVTQECSLGIRFVLRSHDILCEQVNMK